MLHVACSGAKGFRGGGKIVQLVLGHAEQVVGRGAPRLETNRLFERDRRVEIFELRELREAELEESLRERCRAAAREHIFQGLFARGIRASLRLHDTEQVQCGEMTGIRGDSRTELGERAVEIRAVIFRDRARKVNRRRIRMRNSAREQKKERGQALPPAKPSGLQCAAQKPS